MRILADQCRRREKLRKRALASWQQDMNGLLQQAIALDHQLLATPSISPSAKQSKLTADQTSHKQSASSKAAHSKQASSKQALQLAAEVSDATENAQAKFEHDMALSLQLTKGVAEEAAKLHHVKIVRAESSQAAEEAANTAGPSETDRAGDPSLTPINPPPSAELGVSPGRLTRSMQAQGTQPTTTSAPPSQSHRSGASTHAGLQASPTRSSRSGQAAGRNPTSAPVLQSVPQDGSSAAEPALLKAGLQGGHSSASTTPQQSQGSLSKASQPALSGTPVSNACISPRRDTRQHTGVVGQAAAAVDDGSSPQRRTRSTQASVSGRTDGATPSADRQAQPQPTPPSHTHRQTISMQAWAPALDALVGSNYAESLGEEVERTGQACDVLDPAGPLVVEASAVSHSRSSSSLERQGRSTRIPVSTASAHAELTYGAASGAEQQVQLSPRQTRSLRAQASPVLSQQGEVL